jgi:hypothetical protein
MDIELLEAAKEGRERWCVMPVNADCPSQVAVGALPAGVLYGSKSFIVRSLPHVRSPLSRVQHIPFTMFSCA